MDRECQISNSCRTLIQELSWIMRQAHIHAYIDRITGLDNKEAYAASRITHLTVHDFLKHFCSTFPHPSPWRLCLLPLTARQQLLTMLHVRLSPKSYLLPRSTITPQPVEMGQFLLMDPNPIRHPRHQGPHAIPSNICSQCKHRSPLIQE